MSLFSPLPCPAEEGRGEFITNGDGTKIAVVEERTDGKIALDVADDCTSFQAVHLVLVPETDTPIDFTQPVRIVRILNWATNGRVLAKDGSITDSSDATATRVGIAPVPSVPGSRTLPFVTASIHILSPVAAEVTVEGYF